MSAALRTRHGWRGSDWLWTGQHWSFAAGWQLTVVSLGAVLEVRFTYDRCVFARLAVYPFEFIFQWLPQESVA